jgi:hypothetical protein
MKNWVFGCRLRDGADAESAVTALVSGSSFGGATDGDSGAPHPTAVAAIKPKIIEPENRRPAHDGPRNTPPLFVILISPSPWLRTPHNELGEQIGRMILRLPIFTRLSPR